LSPASSRRNTALAGPLFLNNFGVIFFHKLRYFYPLTLAYFRFFFKKKGPVLTPGPRREKLTDQAVCFLDNSTVFPLPLEMKERVYFFRIEAVLLLEPRNGFMSETQDLVKSIAEHESRRAGIVEIEKDGICFLQPHPYFHVSKHAFGKKMAEVLIRMGQNQWPAVAGLMMGSVDSFGMITVSVNVSIAANKRGSSIFGQAIELGLREGLKGIQFFETFDNRNIIGMQKRHAWISFFCGIKYNLAMQAKLYCISKNIQSQ